MNPELTSSIPSSMPMPDIITCHKPALPASPLDRGPLLPDVISNGYYSGDKQSMLTSKAEVNNFHSSVIHDLLDNQGNHCIQRVNELSDKFDFNKLANQNCEVNRIIERLNDMRSGIVFGKNTPDALQELFDAYDEQVNRLNGLIRNQSLHQRHSLVQLDGAFNRAAINQPNFNNQADSTINPLHSSDFFSENMESDRITTGTSYAELWRRLAEIISEIKIDYVDFYASLMLSYTEMYESFNENVQKASSSAVTTGDDGNNVAFDIDVMQAGYDAFQQDVNKLNKELGSVKNWNQMTDDEKSNMIKTLEPAFKVDSTGVITFNMDQYNTVSGSYPAGIKDGKVSTASYQAWLATFNAAGNAFQSNMQSFAQRYSQANNTFDTINKVLSSTISALSDSARDFLR